MYSSLHSTTTTGKKPFYYIFFTFKCNYLYHFYQFISSRLLENKHIPKQQPERKGEGMKFVFSGGRDALLVVFLLYVCIHAGEGRSSTKQRQQNSGTLLLIWITRLHRHSGLATIKYSHCKQGKGGKENNPWFF